MKTGQIITTNCGMQIVIKKVWSSFITGLECGYDSRTSSDTNFRICSFENIKKVAQQPTLF